MHRKVQSYLRAGTQQVWVVYPADAEIVVHTRDGARTLTAGDTLTADPLLPGLRLAVAAIFEA
jgi:Uma2 family endonuclease